MYQNSYRKGKQSEIICLHPCSKWKVMPGLSEERKTSCTGKQAFLFSTGMPAEGGRHGCREGSTGGSQPWGSPHPFLAGGVDVPASLSRGLLPTTSLPKAGKLLLSWPMFQTLGSAFKWLIPEHLPGRPSKTPAQAKGKGCAAPTGALSLLFLPLLKARERPC